MAPTGATALVFSTGSRASLFSLTTLPLTSFVPLISGLLRFTRRSLLIDNGVWPCFSVLIGFVVRSPIACFIISEMGSPSQDPTAILAKGKEQGAVGATVWSPADNTETLRAAIRWTRQC